MTASSVLAVGSLNAWLQEGMSSELLGLGITNGPIGEVNTNAGGQSLYKDSVTQAPQQATA